MERRGGAPGCQGKKKESGIFTLQPDFREELQFSPGITPKSLTFPLHRGIYFDFAALLRVCIRLILTNLNTDTGCRLWSRGRANNSG